MMIINNTYNGKALLKTQGVLESEGCIIKGTPAPESLILLSVDLSSTLCSRKVWVFKRNMFSLIECWEAQSLAAALLHYHPLLCLTSHEKKNHFILSLHFISQ